MKTILLIMIGLSSLSMAQTPRFTKANGVVTDNQTTLEWQDDYSDNEGNIKLTDWIVAIDYCEALTLNGKDDWRLPNKKELLSIVDYGTYDPAISSVFEKTTSGNYWSSTTYATYTNYAWVINFYHGSPDSYAKVVNDGVYSDYYVRCVRAGQ